MQHQLCVLLYSKYSQRSKQLVNALQSAPVDLGSAMGLTLVCVDNEDIRSKIQRATSVKVNSVPTILMVYNNGGVEKYEGERAFMWTQDTIQRLSPPPSPPPPPPPPPQETTPPPSPPDNQELAPEKSKESLKRRRSSKPKRSKKKTTEIVDLDSESEEEDDEDDGRPRPPPVGVRKGAGEYEISRTFGEREEQNRELSNRTSSRSTDLMAMAQAMQKERESSSDNPRRGR